ncbi:MAG: hypothetical protein HETSPECPRED_006716 [Heterodermia speciosa]|uniref:Uncharacterized protein n=1 Tax=Heterodermia speciosa TaxID=116794 RepID=A0A8H3IQQ3_9LECA|nr:MAG: hypothetical protein HETSPECPRED_006716 [Heterodermia speciosa]
MGSVQSTLRKSEQKPKKINDSNLFCSLPEELHQKIVKALDNTTNRSGKTQAIRSRAFLGDLKSLRLVSDLFSKSVFIQTTLFKQIQLVPGPDELRALTQNKIDRIVDYVEAVVFIAPPHSCVLPYEDFKQSALSQAMERYGNQNNILYTHSRVNMLPRWHHRGPQQPPDGISDQELRARYQNYYAHAKAPWLGRALIDAWVSALKVLPNVREIVIRSPRFVHQDIYHKVAAAQVGDEILTAGIAVLVAARPTVRNLKIVCLLTNDVIWEALPGWKALDLSQLQSFTFRPRLWRRIPGLNLPAVDASRTSGSNPTEEEKSEDENLSEQEYSSSGHEDDSEDEEPFKFTATCRLWNTQFSPVAAVLEKSAGSIEKLKYSCLIAMHWPGMEVIPLPKLRYLSLRGYAIRAYNLANWMAQMPSLEHFKLSRASTHYCRGLRNVFDAIRNHPNPMGMRVQLDNVHAARPISLDYHTKDSERFEQYATKDIENVEPVWDELDWSLGLYLSGKIGYNKCLRRYLES